MGLRVLNGAVLALALLSAPYIDAEVQAQLWTWHMNAPVADLLALGALGLASRLLPRRALTADGVTEAAGWVGLWVVGLLAAHNGDGLPGAGPGGLHTLLRKTIFLCLAWRIGVAGLVRSTGPRFTQRWLAASALACAATLLFSSFSRIEAGDTFWWRAIEGLTNNHKTLAMFLAPTIPLLWGQPLVVGLVLVALVLSWSKAALVTSLLATGWMLVPGPWRVRALGAATAAGFGAMTILPWLARSPEQIDALRSRMSLNKRALEMFLAHPWIGFGPGSNVRYEVSTYPDYRVNGVDAHGVFAKLSSEFGLVGTGFWLLATGTLLRVFWRRARGTRGLDDAILGSFLALHLNLLTSTETFSQTHWAILAVLCGLSARSR